MNKSDLVLGFLLSIIVALGGLFFLHIIRGLQFTGSFFLLLGILLFVVVVDSTE